MKRFSRHSQLDLMDLKVEVKSERVINNNSSVSHLNPLLVYVLALKPGCHCITKTPIVCLSNCPIFQFFRSRLTDILKLTLSLLTQTFSHLLSVSGLPSCALLKDYSSSSLLTLTDCSGYYIYSFSYPLHIFILHFVYIYLYTLCICLFYIIKKLRSPFKCLQLNH